LSIAQRGLGTAGGPRSAIRSPRSAICNAKGGDLYVA
jgi:hypothetical protein